MKSSLAAWLWLAAALSAASYACSPRSQRGEQHATLPAGVVARVGDLDIAAVSVARIATAQRLSARAACEHAVSDALLAEAISSDARQADRVRVATRSAHSRALVEALQTAAAQAAPPTDDEVEHLTKERWVELDRPVAVRTAHVVVLVKKPEQDAPARALAERLALELEGVKAPAEFIERARALAGAELELRAERLPPVTPDGRTFDPSNTAATTEQDRFDVDFARAAHALAAPGDHSPVIKTRFGYHVILLEERIPEERVALEDRRRLLAQEVFSHRAKEDLKKLLEQLHQGTAVDTSRASDELTAEVVTSP